MTDIKASHAAIMRSMEALRQTQVEQGRDISELKTDVSELGRGLGVVRDGVATIISLLSDGHGS